MNVTRKQLAAELGISPRTLLRWDKDDALPHIFPGNGANQHGRLYDLDTVKTWLKARPWMLDLTKHQAIAPVCPKCYRRRPVCVHKEAR